MTRIALDSLLCYPETLIKTHYIFVCSRSLNICEFLYSVHRVFGIGMFSLSLSLFPFFKTL